MRRPLIETAFTLVRDRERQRALDVLVTAFTADPVIRWMYPEANRYLTHFPSFLTAFGGNAFTANTVWKLGDFSAVALWFPPHVEPDGDAVAAVMTETMAPHQHEDFGGLLGQMDGSHPRFPHWYLPWFGVDGAQQGKGLGGELLKQCLEIIDKDQLPAYLESPNPRNISFYERHGFDVTGVSQAGACPPVYSMLRGAR
jgi:ribosomal protein S18 acetylase RimI-like enzyme